MKVRCGVYIRGTAEEGLSDEAVWNKAQGERRLLITTDKGFTRRRQEEHHGILVVLLRRPNRHKITRRTIEAMDFSPKSMARITRGYA